MNETQHRRRWTFLQKLQVAQESCAVGMNVTSVARKYGMAPSQLFRWRKLYLSGGQVMVSPSDLDSDHYGEILELRRRVRELERLLGKATVENEILRESIVLDKQRR